MDGRSKPGNPTIFGQFHRFYAQFSNSCMLMCDSRKRAEAEGRKTSFPCGKAMSSHHPTDPVELRRINFQTPGEPDSHACVHKNHLYCVKVYLFLRLTLVLFPFSSLPCISVPRLSPFVKLVGLRSAVIVFLLSIFFLYFSFFLFSLFCLAILILIFYTFPQNDSKLQSGLFAALHEVRFPVLHTPKLFNVI